MSQAPISLADQIKCVKREIAMRERVYPSFVARGKLKSREADWQLEAMRSVLRTLESVGTPGNETLTWRDPATKPDSDVTVMLHAPEASEPVWPGYWDDAEQGWYWVSAEPVAQAVRAWCEMPKGAG